MEIWKLELVSPQSIQDWEYNTWDIRTLHQQVKSLNRDILSYLKTIWLSFHYDILEETIHNSFDAIMSNFKWEFNTQSEKYIPKKEGVIIVNHKQQEQKSHEFSIEDNGAWLIACHTHQKDHYRNHKQSYYLGGQWKFLHGVHDWDYSVETFSLDRSMEGAISKIIVKKN